MAPELRKRKPVAAPEKTNGKPAKVAKTAAATPKDAAKGKRKAADDSSPVSLKKQKPAKKVAAAAPSPAKPSKASELKTKKKAAEKKEEEETRIEVEEESASEDEEEDDAKALAAKLDPEEDDGAKNGSLFKPGQDVGKVPEVPKKSKNGSKSGEEPGVIYIGRIPHGFYEHEMKQYFSQFGPINKLRLSRNKKTGASKHFAFVEFAEASTAEIVSKTMDNYLLFGHILKCKVIPKEQVHDNLFKGANKRFKKIPWNKMAGKNLEKPLSETAWKDKISREKNKRAKNADKLKALGYEFDAPDLKDAPAPLAIENGEDTEAKAIEAAPVEAPEAEEAPEKVEEAEPEESKVEAKSSPATKGKAAKAKAPKATKARKGKA